MYSGQFYKAKIILCGFVFFWDKGLEMCSFFSPGILDCMYVKTSPVCNSSTSQPLEGSMGISVFFFVSFARTRSCMESKRSLHMASEPGAGYVVVY